MLQTMPTNRKLAAVLQQNSELLAVVSAPNIEVVGHDLRTHHLAAAKRDACWQFGLIHILADKQASNKGIGVVRHWRLTSTPEVVVRSSIPGVYYEVPKSDRENGTPAPACGTQFA